METLLQKPVWIVVVVILCVAIMLAGQAVADNAFDGQTFTSTGAAMGRAGFAYLTGLRTFAAAVIWNRTDPIYHGYYHDKPLQEQTQALPMIKLVVTLSPDFVDAYSVGAWIVIRRGLVDEGIDLARDGVEKNPRSGLLRANYAQLLWLYGDDMDEAVAQADIAFQSDMVWRDLIEQHDNYAVLTTLYDQAGETEKSEQVMVEIERLDAEIGDALPTGSHDHDGDGIPDH